MKRICHYLFFIHFSCLFRIFRLNFVMIQFDFIFQFLWTAENHFLKHMNPLPYLFIALTIIFISLWKIWKTFSISIRRSKLLNMVEIHFFQVEFSKQNIHRPENNNNQLYPPWNFTEMPLHYMLQTWRCLWWRNYLRVFQEFFPFL